MSDNKNVDSNMQILLFKKYNLLKNIGGGAFGTVFLGQNVWTKEKVAIKIEERKNQKNSIEKEAYTLYTLKGPGLPEIISFGKTKRYNILIETLLGRSLYQIYNDCDKKFTIKDICMAGIQMLERLEYIHSKNYIHRDIKPHNFLVSTKNEGLIYIIDFGLAKKYRSERGNHVKFGLTKHITGTPRFCSINAMRGIEQSRRDDLESLSYLILYFIKGSLPWQGLKIQSRSQRFKEITRLKKNLKIENNDENIPPEIVLFFKYTRKLGFTENPKYEYMRKLFISVLNKYGFINDQKFSWISDTNEGKTIENIKNLRLHKNSPHKRLIDKLRDSLVKKQKAKSKEKDNNNNNDYTLTTIFMENNNNISDISELNKRKNELGKKILIQSNDNEILVKNNIIQLNVENPKRSYNYPLVIYKNNLSKQNQDNNFNKIVQTFQSNDSNILHQNENNIADKISMINVSGSNLINIQISADQELILNEKEKENVKNTSKAIKIHDYIRQEEKEGGVIDKDFDYRENDYFKINQPIFPSEQTESENDENRNKHRISMTNNNNRNDNNIIKNKTFILQKNLSISGSNNNYNIIKNNNNGYNDEKGTKKVNNKIIIYPKENENIIYKQYIKLPSPKCYQPKFNSFFIKKVSINLNKNNLNKNNFSPKNMQPKTNNSYIQINTAKRGIKYVKINQQTKNAKENPNKKQYIINNKNNNYELSDLNLRNSNINANNSKNQTQINYNSDKDKLNIKLNNKEPQNGKYKIKLDYNNLKNNTNRIFNIRKNKNTNKLNQINSINNDLNNNSNKLRNSQNNNVFHMINNNANSFNNGNKQNKSYQVQNNYQKMNLKNPFKPTNNNLNNNLIKSSNTKNNNIIINNLIIKNNCEHLLYKNNLNNNNNNSNKNQNSKINNIKLRHSINTSKIEKSFSNIQYKPLFEVQNFKNENNVFTEPK